MATNGAYRLELEPQQKNVFVTQLRWALSLGVVHYLVEVALPLIFHLMLRFLFFLQRRRWRWRQRPQISHRWRGNHNPNFIPTVKRNMVVNILFHVQCLNWALAIRSIVLSKQSFLKPPLESGRFLCLRQSWPGIGLKCIYLSIDELRDRDNRINVGVF